MSPLFFPPLFFPVAFDYVSRFGTLTRRARLGTRFLAVGANAMNGSILRAFVTAVAGLTVAAQNSYASSHGAG